HNPEMSGAAIAHLTGVCGLNPQLIGEEWPWGAIPYFHTISPQSMGESARDDPTIRIISE
ncbi:MAG: hypothetical protein AAF245_05530, partial [Pseudomonadota bacterium]